MKSEDNPMRREYAMRLSPRCGARTRSGTPCCGPAMSNGRCRMHGGRSPGAPKGEANGVYRHGRYTNEAVAQRRELTAWVRAMRRVARDIV
ncbi:HGGxSTG domain-containing protein [Methylobacterium sp. WSM2598]|uniref:HGGxSTG domain-containing protein n=1 Tax=Methylobacterium sp. WSM2598 TaxID=398261 RepID=UPI002E813CCE|nr:HGGxSTG domain-containing protein [Methylobacterium sp. WSM2598]